MVNVPLIAACGFLALAANAFADSPYAGQEQRQVKSLSAAEVEALRDGKGMGFAKVAELNHYPGPKHVLELAAELELTQTQVHETEQLFTDMQTRARSLGRELVDAEAALDRAFAEQAIDKTTLEAMLFQVGELRARLRYVHLEAHLRQRALLTEDQVVRYDELRGYGRESMDPTQHDGKHH